MKRDEIGRKKPNREATRMPPSLDEDLPGSRKETQVKSNTSGGKPKKNGRGFTLYSNEVFTEQLRQVVSKHSASHALALLVLHRRTSGNRQKQVDATETAMAAMLGLTRGQANRIMVALEKSKVIVSERQRAENNARIASLVSLEEDYVVEHPHRASRQKGYTRIDNCIVDSLMRYIVESAGASAALVYMVLVWRAREGVVQVEQQVLADQLGISLRAVRASFGRLEEAGYLKRSSSSRGMKLLIGEALERRAPMGARSQKEGVGAEANTPGGRKQIHQGRKEMHHTKEVPTRDRGVHQNQTGRETPAVSSGSGESVNAFVDDRGDGAAVFRTSTTQPVDRSSWGAREKPEDETAKGAEAPSSRRQKLIQMLTTTKEQSREINDGYLDFAYPADIGTWSITEYNAKCLAGNFEGHVDQAGLVKVAGEYFTRMQAESTEEYPEDDAEHHAISIVRTIGRVIGAYQRGEVRSCRHYLVDALEKNATAWKLVGYDSEDDIDHVSRYGLSYSHVYEEEESIRERELWRGGEESSGWLKLLPRENSYPRSLAAPEVSRNA